MYLVVDTEVEFLVAGSNRHVGVGIRVISCAWFEDDVAVVLETTNQPQILSAINMYCTRIYKILCAKFLPLLLH